MNMYMNIYICMYVFHTFYDVLARGGAVGLAADRVKSVRLYLYPYIYKYVFIFIHECICTYSYVL